MRACFVQQTLLHRSAVTPLLRNPEVLHWDGARQKTSNSAPPLVADLVHRRHRLAQDSQPAVAASGNVDTKRRQALVLVCTKSVCYPGNMRF
eukprot:CAMPEP_0168365040 /NCGR_PEP_ID=MMETSP0228-20121227/4515_1 /TAXON_ID=133427 /ORGANISM="Protoceratium reticulatum, Strain CCCM 535 (=CCMP 1889)" /LENGTH=91 /DNA_ID=CAMNT_0008377813 /DNA_START=265 /DNA_END=540 /DNA_ORIENTATION=-